MQADVVSQRTFLGGSALLFAAGAGATILWCGSMSDMGGMPMPGGWTMSMTWMRMPGQTWPGVAASFLGMWTVMMATMMLPVLVPMLWRYRRAVGGSRAAPLARLTVLVALAYFLVWTVLGAVVFPLGVGVAALEMQLPALARAVPAATALLLTFLGALQLTAWKARRLASYGRACHPRSTNAGAPWQHGLRIGLQCSSCCANLMAIALVLGIMDLRVMALCTLAISIERLAPSGERVARAVGVIITAVGSCMLLRAGFAG
jgi:predicted metal-binding membrane protein